MVWLAYVNGLLNCMLGPAHCHSDYLELELHDDFIQRAFQRQPHMLFHVFLYALGHSILSHGTFKL